MPVDLRCKHDREVRTRAADLFAAGRGSKSVARELRIPEGAVRKWLLTYRAVGRETLLGMGKSHTRYSRETKVAAASAVVDGGRPKPEVMAELGIASLAPLKAWCRAWREGGAEALRPRPKGRPRGAGPKAAPKTREQELEERVRRLTADPSPSPPVTAAFRSLCAKTPASAIIATRAKGRCATLTASLAPMKAPS